MKSTAAVTSPPSPAEAWLNSLGSSRTKLGTERIKQWLKVLDHPEKTYPCVIVGGTNGKGSVVASLTAILFQAGFKVGSTISPHLVTPRERIRINTNSLSSSDFEKVALDLKETIDSQKDIEPPTYFEALIIMAFLAFQNARVDIAILEVGLGGRLDAVNILEKPLATIITSIGLDHTEILGDSLEKIAMEKAGIFREATPVILGPNLPEEARQTLLEQAQHHKASPIIETTSECLHPEPWPGLIQPSRIYRNLVSAERYETNLLGGYQKNNIATTLATTDSIRRAGFAIPAEAIQAGLRSVDWPARFQWFDDKRWLVDGSHNRDGLAALTQSLKEALPETWPCVWVIGLKNNRDPALVSYLLNQFAKQTLGVICTQPTENNRLFHSAMSLRRFLRRNVPSLATRFIWAAESSKEAFWMAERVRQAQQPEAIGLATGSLYLAGEMLSHLNSD